MKVLHIITRMNTGGPAVFLDHLTKSMADLGTKSIIAYGYCESNEADYIFTFYVLLSHGLCAKENRRTHSWYMDHQRSKPGFVIKRKSKRNRNAL